VLHKSALCRTAVPGILLNGKQLYPVYICSTCVMIVCGLCCVLRKFVIQVLAESYEHKDTLWDEYECPKFIPFNPVDKYTIAIIKDKKSGEMMRIMKGAPQVSACACSPFPKRCAEVLLCMPPLAKAVHRSFTNQSVLASSLSLLMQHTCSHRT